MSFPQEILVSVYQCGSLLAQTEAPAAVPLSPIQQFLSSPFLLLGGIMALFYVVVMIPERRRKADDAARLASIKKNDRVVTTAGIHCVVASIGENGTLILRLDESGNAKMKVDRSSIARILTDPTETNAKDPSSPNTTA